MSRSWGDLSKEEAKKGKFEDWEYDLLKKELEDYRIRNEVEWSDFYSNLDQARGKARAGFWPRIAACLQDRTVKSVKNYCQRKFSVFNYKGKWSQEEVQILKNVVAVFGRKWGRISKLLERSLHNVRDKWKEIEKLPENGVELFWSLENTLKLVRCVETAKNIEIINNIDDLRLDEYEEFLQDKLANKPEKAQKFMQNNLVSRLIYKKLKMSFAQVISIKGINWEKVSKDMKTNISPGHCKNKWYSLFHLKLNYKRKLAKIRVLSLKKKAMNYMMKLKKRLKLSDLLDLEEFEDDYQLIELLDRFKDRKTNSYQFLRDINKNFDDDDFLQVLDQI